MEADMTKVSESNELKLEIKHDYSSSHDGIVPESARR